MNTSTRNPGSDDATQHRIAIFFTRHPSAFTLLEMLVATTIFSLMIVMLLQLTSGLMTNANRVDENLKTDQDVRILFDLMRRDLAQARIGTNQNQFYGTPTQVSFVSSTSRLKSNYVSDQRLVTYYLENNTIYRAVVEPTMENYPAIWDPINPSWWTKDVKANAEALLEGVYPYDSGNYKNPFMYELGDKTLTNTVSQTNPPRGLIMAVSVASKRAMDRAGTGGTVGTNDLKTMKYDIEHNIPPVFNP